MTFCTYLFHALLLCATLLPSANLAVASPRLNQAQQDEDEVLSQEEKVELSKISSKGVSPILMRADNINYDQETEIVVATGNVEIAQGDRLLMAQKIIYNKKTGKMTAEGKVLLKETQKLRIAPNPDDTRRREFLSHQDLIVNRLRQTSLLMSNPLNLPDLGKQLTLTPNEDLPKKVLPDYNLSFAPYAEFNDKFQDGFIRDAKMLLSDNARLAANSAKRIGGQKVIFRQAVYSPCDVCRMNPLKSPLWQLKADKVIHSKVDQIIIYHHARLEMGGIPVFYLPYFRHADPTVKRKTGFLMPAFGRISDLGMIVSTPFYYVIEPNRDLTLIPIITTKQGPLMVAEYRHLFLNGHITGSTSYTQTHDLKKIPKGSNLPGSDRWHIFTQGRLDLNDENVATFDINRASDTTYLRRYPILPQGFRLKYPVKNMISTAAIEQFGVHNYGVVRTTVYQTDNQATTPYLLPHAWYNYQTDPDAMNGIWNFDANFLSLGRRLDTPGRNARHMQRLSLNGGWRLPYITPTGHVWTLQMNLRGDSYVLEHFQPSLSKPPQSSTFRGRLFPTASAQWRYPLVKHLSFSQWVVEPTAMIVGTPRVSNRSIPNEDSLNIQVEDTSLFLPQRFSGLDRVDTGGRFIYGANSTWFFPKKRLIQLFLGQSVRMDHNQVLPIGAGENKHASDIVSRFRLNPMDGIQLLNRMAIHYKNGHPRISDTSAIFGKKILILQLNHTFVNKYSTTNGVGISQATWVLGTQPVDHWSFSLGETRNLKQNQHGALSRTISALYHDECFRMTMSAFRTRSSDRDIRPNTGLIIQFDFKNLGSISPLDTFGINANNL
ncbi:MAG: LPS assembly protein LptD [Alphaproteobacteria bacterium]|jgi:LPS-assembly protein|nr:LPS assembly protein LptD [Alphaproteobacteria bacterium]